MLRRLCALLTLFQLALQTYSLGLLAVDYGADSFKASYVGPGVPFDVLYNKDSKRKTPSMVTLHGQDVLVGGDASAVSTRFPKETFQSVKMLLGGSADDPLVKAHQGLFDSHFISPKSGQHQSDRLALYKSDGTSYAPEEILAMQLSTARDMAIQAAKGDKSFDAVITVPAYFDQSQRQAILDAADLAGLRLLSLVNDGSAAAVNYAMTRTFPSAPAKPERHLIYDAGASAIRATVVSFETIQVKVPASIKPKDATQLTVHGLGWSDAVGGFELDHRLRRILAGQFKEDVSKNDRAMAKFLKEAVRVKHVLSANTAAPARIENILPDVDFKGSVTREEFQEACADLDDAFASPITQALANANMSMGDLDSVILVGGASRVPMIQNAVKRVVPEAKIAQNLNADEAAVMGAVLYGAGLSSQFKAKDIRVNDISPRAVEIAYESVPSEEGASPQVIRDLLFKQNSRLDSREVVPFKRTSDFDLDFAYLTETGSSPLFQAHISGFETALVNLTEAEVQNATVKVTVEQTTSSLITIPRAVFELPERSDDGQGVAGKLWNMVAGNKDADTEGAQPSDEAQEKKGGVKAAEKRPLTVTFKQTGSRATVLSENEKEAAKRRLRDLEQAEARKKLREEARNVLEAFTYKARDLAEQADFQVYASQTELKNIKEQLDNTASWIWDEGETAAIKELRSRRTDLEKLVSAVTMRATEANIRPTLVSALQLVLQQADSFLGTSMADMTAESAAGEVSRHTQAELDSLQSLIQTSRQWLDAGIEKQKTLAQSVDPALRKVDLEGKAKALTAEIERLSKKRKPRTSSTTSATSSSAAESASDSSKASSSADAEETQGDKHPRDEL